MTAHRPYSAAEDARVVALHSQGNGCAAIARELGRHPSSVDWRLIVLGLKVPGTRRASPKPKTPTTSRTCLCCQRTFGSDWIGNRVCDDCKKTQAWQAGCDYGVVR